MSDLDGRRELMWALRDTGFQRELTGRQQSPNLNV